MTINRREFIGAGLAIMGAGLAGCAGSGGSSDWVTLVDGKSVPAGWKQLGEGNWKARVLKPGSQNKARGTRTNKTQTL